MSRKKSKNSFICSVEKLEQFSQDLYKNSQAESSYVISIDNSMQISNMSTIADGDRDSVEISPQTIKSISSQYRGKNVLLIHNHPDNSDISLEDYLTTTEIIDSFNEYGIKTIDHIVVSKSGITSIKQKLDEK